MHEEIITTEEPKAQLAVAEFEARVDEIGEHIGSAFATVGAWLARHQVTPIGPALAYYSPTAHGFRVRAGFQVAEPVNGDDQVHGFERPGPPVGPGSAGRRGGGAPPPHDGPYNSLPEAYDAIRTYAAEHALSLDETAMWEEYLSGPDAAPDATRTRILWPLRA